MSDSQRNFPVDNLPHYVLGELASSVLAARLKGRDVVDLSQINPDLGPPPGVVDKLVQTSLRKENHRYSASAGIFRIRQAISEYYEREFEVSLDPHKEVVTTMGSKEAVVHLLQAVCHTGSIVVLPTPAYPVHRAAAVLAGAEVKEVEIPIDCNWSNLSEPLTGDLDEFFQSLEDVFANSNGKQLIFLFSFPHNPTARIVDISFFERLVSLSRKYNVLLVHDFAYSNLCFEPYSAPSILEVEGAKDIAVELFSMSKNFAIPGWRVGFAVGQERVISALKKFKSYVDFGIFQPLQIASASVLESSQEFVEELKQNYASRRDTVCSELDRIGWRYVKPQSTVFVWAQIPPCLADRGSMQVCQELLERADLAICPGVGFGDKSDNYVRISLGETEARIRYGFRCVGEDYTVSEVSGEIETCNMSSPG